MALNPPLTLPYIFVNGTIIDAGQVNADFAALTNAMNNNVRSLLTAPSTFYVAPGGADVPGNGLSITSPAATIGYILNLLRAAYDLNNQEVTIQLANGTYTENVELFGQLPGQEAASEVRIQGNMAAPNLVTLNGDPCFNVNNGGLLQIQGMTLTSSVSQCIISQQAARVVFNTCIFGAAATGGAHLLAARGGSIRANGNYTIAGGGAAHGLAVEAGEIFLDSEPRNYMNPPLGIPTINLTGTPNFSNAFVVATNLGCMRITATFVGGATGIRSNARFNSVINIVGQGDTYLPGSLPGTADTGGICQ